MRQPSTPGVDNTLMNYEPGTLSSQKIFKYVVGDKDQGLRLDHFLASQGTALSRSRIQGLIRKGSVEVNHVPSRPSYRVREGDHVSVSIPPPVSTKLTPEPVAFEIVHEDDSIIVVNKPPGLVVHPAPGHASGTLVHGLLWQCGDLSGIGGVTRPGIVHRLDKDTSGLIVVAKNDHAHAALARQFKSGEIKKEYRALVHGFLKGGKGEVDLPIARHPRKRKEMCVSRGRGKRALTIWWTLETIDAGFSLLAVSIKTGRTHQIRVHLSHLGHPVVGDPVYGYGKNWWKRSPFGKMDFMAPPERQMLHATALGFFHPKSGRFVEFTVPLPRDFLEVLGSLREAAGKTLTVGHV